MTRRFRAVVHVAVALGIGALLTTGLLALPDAPRTLAQSAVVVVRITSVLEPSAVTVAPGTTVRWDNADSTRHRIRATSGPAEFDGDLEPGASFSFRFTAVGTYQYRDDRARSLSNYWGTVTVTGSATSSPTATGTTGGGTPAPTTSNEVTMAGRAFNPGALTISPGSVVTWRNNDGREHTVTARDGSFESGVLAGGATFQKTFTVAGAFAYICAIHPDMTGTVTVTGAGGATATATPTATATATATTTAASSVRIIDFGFAPVDFHVPVGGTVTWVNNGVALHTVTARDGSFDSGYLSAGGTFSRAFATAGTYQYLCALHSNMSGSIVVDSGTGTPTATATTTATGTPKALPASDIRTIDFAFEPAQLQVQVGAAVTWANVGVAPHTVTARDGSFDSGTIKPGATFSHQFNQAGTFLYLCGLHADMTGTVVVADAAGAIPPPQPAPKAVTSRVPPPGVTDVEVVDFGFAPASVQVQAGGTVRWVNSGVAPHSVTAQDRSFDSGYLSRGEQFTRTYPREGTFPYLCSLHPGMVGEVVVGAGGGGALGTTSARRGVEAQPPPSNVGDAASGDRVDAQMRDFDFEPARVIVKPGTTVAWKNVGVAPHTVTARDGSFSSGIKSAGESFEHRFDTAGTFDYVCAVHPAMVGTVEVKADVTAAPGASGQGSPSGAARGESGADGGGVSIAVLLTTALMALAVGVGASYVIFLRATARAEAK